MALGPDKADINDSDLSDVNDSRVSHADVPGDSYPAVAASLDDIESDVNTDVEELDADNNHKKRQVQKLIFKK